MNIYKKIYKTNINLLKKIDEGEVKVKYLPEDVLLISLPVPARYSDSIEIADGLLIIHYNPNNYKITGFTVPYVKEFIQLSLTMQEAKQKSIKKKKKHVVKPQTIASAGMYGLSFAT